MLRRLLFSLRFRLLLLAVFLIGLTAAMFLQMGSQLRKQTEQEVMQQAQQLATVTSSGFLQVIDGGHQLLIALAEIPAVSSMDVAAAESLFRELLQHFPQYTDLILVNSNGDLVASGTQVTSLINFADRPYFQRVLSTRSFVVGDYAVGRVTGRSVVTLSYPIVDSSGQVRAVLTAGLDLEWLDKLIPISGLPANSTFFLIDSGGVVLAQEPQREKWVGKQLTEVEVMNVILGQRSSGVVVATGLDGVRRLWGYVPLGDKEGPFLAVGIAESVAYAGIDRATTTLLWALGLLVGIVLAAALSLITIVLRPLRCMTNAAKRISAGDLDHSCGLSRAHGEMADLSRSFENMAGALKERQQEAQRATDLLRTSEERSRGTLDGMLEGCQIIDHDWLYVYVNDAAAQQGHRKKGEMLGRTLMEVYPGIEGTEEFRRILDCMENRFPYEMENEFTYPDGTKGWFDLRIEPVPEGVLLLSIDITERKQAEEKLNRALSDLERSNTQLQEFAYVVSHDLREPLRMVTSFLQILEKRYKGRLDKDADGYINFAVEGGTRMQAMIDDILQYSRVGTQGRAFEPVETATIIGQAQSNLKAAIEESGAVVTHSKLPQIMADQLQMVSLFQNLIGNGIKFRGEEPPRVHISAERKGGEWVFSVRDNGIGIAPENIPRLFKMFRRFHDADKYPGSGMGLAIAKRIVERHGGRIWVESEQGEGSTFYFSLPAATNITSELTMDEPQDKIETIVGRNNGRRNAIGGENKGSSD